MQGSWIKESFMHEFSCTKQIVTFGQTNFPIGSNTKCVLLEKLNSLKSHSAYYVLRLGHLPHWMHYYCCSWNSQTYVMTAKAESLSHDKREIPKHMIYCCAFRLEYKNNPAIPIYVTHCKKATYLRKDKFWGFLTSTVVISISYLPSQRTNMKMPMYVYTIRKI